MWGMFLVSPVVSLNSTFSVGGEDVAGPSWDGGMAKGEGCKAAADCERRFAAPNAASWRRYARRNATLSYLLKTLSQLGHSNVHAFALMCLSIGCCGLLFAVAGVATAKGAAISGRSQPGEAWWLVMRGSVCGGMTVPRVCHCALLTAEPGVTCSSGEAGAHVAFGRAGRRSGKRACGRARQQRGGARRQSTSCATSGAGEGL